MTKSLLKKSSFYSGYEYISKILSLTHIKYSGAHISWHEFFFTRNQDNHQNLVPSMLTRESNESRVKQKQEFKMVDSKNCVFELCQFSIFICENFRD